MKWFTVKYNRQSGEVNLYADSFYELAERIKGSDVLKIEYVSDIKDLFLSVGTIIYRTNSGRQYLYRINKVSRLYGYIEALGLYRKCRFIIDFSELERQWAIVRFHG